MNTFKLIRSLLDILISDTLSHNLQNSSPRTGTWQEGCALDYPIFYRQISYFKVSVKTHYSYPTYNSFFPGCKKSNMSNKNKRHSLLSCLSFSLNHLLLVSLFTEITRSELIFFSYFARAEKNRRIYPRPITHHQ